MNVGDIMTANPFSIEPEAPVASAIDVMVERKIRHLPVVDEHGALIGIVTDRDAVKALARQVPALRRLAAG